ncbi:CpaF family protein [Methanobrevibacter curvatus]|nr:CpaF family protein [Methanobrevibacter curvatus]
MQNNETIPIYKLNKIKLTKNEEYVLNEIRNGLVDLAISSGGDLRLNKDELLKDIKNFIKLNLSKEKQSSENINKKNGKNERVKENKKIKENKRIRENKENEENYMNSNHDKYETYIDKLSQICYQEFLGYGDIDPLLNDDDLEEIMIIGTKKPVFVYHRKHGMMKTDLIFDNEEKIISIIDLIARDINRRIDKQTPILDGRLKDGSRINATLEPVSSDGPTLTIRKFKKDPLTIIDLISLKTINSSLAAYFWLVVDGLGVKPANIIISGGTSSGKTTTLNSLGNLINPRERIITIEDTLELQIPHEHVLRMETRSKNIEQIGEIDMDDLVKNSLRQRPDRIIVGEVRGKEAITLFTALNTGHSGFGTLHANNSRETINRLIHPPMAVPKIMISAIDLIVMQNRIYQSNGVSIRRVTEVCEVVGMEEDTVQLNKIFIYNPEIDDIENISISSEILRKIADIKGISLKDIDIELKKRKTILEFMEKNKIRSNEEVSNFLNEYYRNSDELLGLISLNSK